MWANHSTECASKKSRLEVIIIIAKTDERESKEHVEIIK